MPYARNMSENFPVVATIDPQATTATTAVETDAIDLSKYRRVLFIVQTGTIAHTLDFKIRAATSAGGSYADVDATNAALTQIADTSDNKVAVFELRCEKIAALNLGYTHVKGRVTPGGTSSCTFSVVAIGDVARYQPGSATDLADVIEIKVY